MPQNEIITAKYYQNYFGVCYNTARKYWKQDKIEYKVKFITSTLFRQIYG